MNSSSTNQIIIDFDSLHCKNNKNQRSIHDCSNDNDEETFATWETPEIYEIFQYINHDRETESCTDDSSCSNFDINDLSCSSIGEYSEGVLDDCMLQKEFDEQLDNIINGVEEFLQQKKEQKGKKKVTFGSIFIREYSLTVGAQTAVSDSCPLQLNWEYSPFLIVKSLTSTNSLQKDQSNDTDKKFNIKVRHLSLNQRRQRIATVQGISTTTVQMMECEAAFQTVHMLIKSTKERLTENNGQNCCFQAK